MRFLAGTILLVLLAAQTVSARDYYLSATGKDDASGTQQDPWRTLSRACKEQLGPGDRLLLQGGEAFEGTLILDHRHSGVSGRPVVVSSWGNGTAVIQGGTQAGITLTGSRWITIRNLHVRGAGRLRGSTTSGIVISGAADVELDDVAVTGFQHSGIEIRGTDRIRVQRIHAFENGFAGISSREPVSHDVYVGHSLLENNPGDPTVKRNHSGNGVVLGYVQRGVIEYTEARYNGWDMVWTGNGPVGIWAYNSDRITIQFCVSHHNRSTATDGGGFDFDGGMTNSVMQHNYSHDNFGTGYLICQYPGAPEFANNIVRYNISQDDGLLAHNSGIYVWVGGSGFRSSVVHNNTIFNTKGSAVAFSVEEKYKDQLPRLGFYNNIFVSRIAQIRDLKLGGSLWQFAGNVYWSVGERGFDVDGQKSFTDWVRTSRQEMLDGKVAGVYADPGLRKDGAGLISSPGDLGKLHEYLLKPGAAAGTTGVDLHSALGIDPGVRDFFGAPTSRSAGAASISSR